MWRLSTKVLEPIRRQLGVAHGMLDVPVAEIGLQGAGVVALVGHRMPFADSETARGESKPKAGTSERTMNAKA